MPDADSSINTLFVYGSLRSEFDNPHARFLREHAESLGHATVGGSLFLVGAYSGYRHTPKGTVHGELWRLRNPKITLAALDAYEGSTYPRVVVEVLEGLATHAWIYVYIGEVQPDERIASGDFLKL